MHVYSQLALLKLYQTLASSGRESLYLSQTFLSSPHRCVNDLEEELASPGVEDENSSIDWLCGQVTLKCLLSKNNNTRD